MRVRVLRENKPPQGFSSVLLEPLRVFYFLSFYFVFGAHFEELATKGAFSIVEQSLRRISSLICFVSLNFTLLFNLLLSCLC